MTNPIESNKRGGILGGRTVGAPQEIYFHRSPPMPTIACKNAHKTSADSYCDSVARVGFSTCEGCVEHSRESIKDYGFGELLRAIR